MTSQAEFAALQFKDGDSCYGMFEYQDKTLGNFQIEIGAKAIFFYEADEDGIRYDLPSEPERVRLRPRSPLLGETSYSILAQPDGRDQFEWHGYSTSTVDTLNAVAQSVTQPLGAHAMPLELMDADRDDGLFDEDTMVEAIADGVFVIATNARNYLHDTKDHGLGLICLEAESAQTLRSICQLAELEKRCTPLMEYFMKTIVNAYDLSTFQYTRPTADPRFQQLSPTRRDPLLSEIMYQTIGRKIFPNEFISRVVATIEEGPFTYKPANRQVNRYRSVKKYYESISDLVA